MAGALDLVLTITAADAGSAVLDRFTKYLVRTKGASKELSDQLDRMNKSINVGIKSLALARYGWEKLRPGVTAAADLQEAMNQVERNTAGSVSNVRELTALLGKVRGTALDISSAPGSTLSTKDIVGIENSLLKAGLPVSDVIGRSGAAFAATALSTLANVPADVTGDALAKVGNQFKLSGEQYTQAADWLARVDDATATSIPQLLKGLEMSGASAAGLKVSLRDTVTALGQLSPLGDRAGSSLDGFFRGLKMQRWAFGPDGFIGLPKAIEELQKRLSALPDEQSRLIALQKAFGDEGGRAALTFITSASSFSDIETAARNTLDLMQKMEISAKTLNNVSKGAANSFTNLGSTMFAPALGPLAGGMDATKTSVNSAAKYFDEHQGAAAVATGLAGAVLAGTAAYGIGKILTGGLAGAKALRMAGGLGNLVGGVAKGAAVQEVTGGRVQPVYVTNWPGSGSPGSGSVTGSIADAIAGASVLKGGAATLRLLKTMPALAALSGSLGAGAFGLASAGVVGAGAAGYGVGSAISWLIDKALSATTGSETSLGSWLYDLTHREDAARAALGTDPLKPAEIGGIIRIELDDNGRLRVRDIRKTGNADVDFSVNSGRFFYGLAAP